MQVEGSFFERYRFRRNYQYFRAIKTYMADYLSICKKIQELEARNIGIALDAQQDRWEYPFWPILKNKLPEMQIKWVIFPDDLEETRNFDPEFVPDVIITDFAPDIISQKFEIEHAVRYEHFVLVLIKKKGNESKGDTDTEKAPQQTERVR